MSPAFYPDDPTDVTEFRLVQERAGVRVVVRESIAEEEIDAAIQLFEFMAPKDLRTFVEARRIVVTEWEPVEAPEPAPEIPRAPPVPVGGEGGRCVRHGEVARAPVWMLVVQDPYSWWTPRCPEEHRKGGKPAVCYAPLELPEKPSA